VNTTYTTTEKRVSHTPYENNQRKSITENFHTMKFENAYVPTYTNKVKHQ